MISSAVFLIHIPQLFKHISQCSYIFFVVYWNIFNMRIWSFCISLSKTDKILNLLYCKLWYMQTTMLNCRSYLICSRHDIAIAKVGAKHQLIQVNYIFKIIIVTSWWWSILNKLFILIITWICYLTGLRYVRSVYPM